MPTLFHLPLSPFCRKVRLVAAEKGVGVELVVEEPWRYREEFLALNPAAQVPVWVDDDGTTIPESTAIAEFLDETEAGPSLIGEVPADRAEVRRLAAWFDVKFSREVTDYLYGERLMKRIRRLGEPDSMAIRAGRQNILHHLDYIAWLAERRNWLAGDRLSLADLAAGAQLSTLDYLGEVPWDHSEGAKVWYQRLKSRPSFRPLLADSIPGFPPPGHYALLDF
jgi:glutathione S-transferase